LLTTADFRAGYVRRIVDDELDALLPELGALLLDGPKAVGKTATALQRAATVRRLATRAERELAAADPAQALAGPHPVLLDEWQRVPDLWDEVKTDVDDHPTGGRFLLTGSAPSGATHSGAGRIPSLRMRPLTLPERGVVAPSVSLAALLEGDRPAVAGTCTLGLGNYTDLIVASGFPGLQHLSPYATGVQLDGYLTRIVEVDMEEAGHRVNRPATLQAWMRAYAAATATATSWEKIRDAARPGNDARPARSTTVPYIEALNRLRVLDDIPAWIPSRNHLKRVGQAPKHHLVDPALAARLLGLGSADLLRGAGPERAAKDGPFLGALFESLAAMSVRVFASAARATVSHLRLQDGRHEVDLIVERDDHKYLAVEVKLSGTIDDHDTTHLHWLRREDQAHLLDAVVLTTGTHAYRRSDGVAVVPLGLLGP
jgi:predicted AAA+ superfamily ATPase